MGKTLKLTYEEALSDRDALGGKDRAIAVRVTVAFKDEEGHEYCATRTIRMRVRRTVEKP